MIPAAGVLGGSAPEPGFSDHLFSFVGFGSSG